jgi:hypothetical protein
MKRIALVSVLSLCTLVPGAAWAATVTGRITYLDRNSHRLMLDNSEMFVLAPDLPATGLDVGRLVTVDVATRGTDRVITKVLKYT